MEYATATLERFNLSTVCQSRKGEFEKITAKNRQGSPGSRFSRRCVQLLVPTGELVKQLYKILAPRAPTDELASRPNRPHPDRVL
jgi:hypothetical protein